MSAAENHRLNHKVKEIFLDTCHYCRDEKDAVKSGWKWLVQHPPGEYYRGKKKNRHSKAVTRGPR